MPCLVNTTLWKYQALEMQAIIRRVNVLWDTRISPNAYDGAYPLIAIDS